MKHYVFIVLKEGPKNFVIFPLFRIGTITIVVQLQLPYCKKLLES